MPETELIMDKAGREAWIEEQSEGVFGGLDLDDSKYYDIEEPFDKEKWINLIEDLNELFENPPGECSAVNALDVPEGDYVVTRKDVETIRERMQEMCADIDFDWGWYLPDWEGSDEDKNLLIQPIGREFIYEIEDQMLWCNCGDNAYSVAEARTYLGGCEHESTGSSPGANIKSTIEGMQVGSPRIAGGWTLYLWRHWYLYAEEEEYLRAIWAADNPGEPIPWIVGRNRSTTRIMSGSLDCRGAVDFGSNNPDRNFAGDALIDYNCYPDRECVLATEPPPWWFGPGWEEHRQQEYEDCLEELQELRDAAITAAEAEVAERIAEDDWIEYMLVARSFGYVNEECEEEEGGSP